MGSVSRVSDRDDWFEIWDEDKQSILETMRRNIASDIEAGYDPIGDCVARQWAEREKYKEEYEDKLDMFAGMEEKEVNRWCYYDLKKRGAIT